MAMGPPWRIRSASDVAPPLLIVNKQNTRNSLREIEMLKQLRHHCIIGVHSTEDLGSILEVRFSLLDLGTVEHIISTAYPEGLPEQAIIPILAKTLSAISYLHSNLIIHRAIKASNVWVDTGGDVKLGGFNHAVAIKECNKWFGVESHVYEFDESLEEVLLWLAPEILKQDLDGYSTSSDIYSLGAFCCELGNGFAPFAEMEPTQMLYEKLRGSTPFLIDSGTASVEEDNGGLSNKEPYSAKLHAIVGKCMAYAPAERPSADELLAELDYAMKIEQNLAQLLSRASRLEYGDRE